MSYENGLDSQFNEQSKLKKATDLFIKIKKLQLELIDLEQQIPQAKCPNCKTYNYHFKNGSWCCAFC